MRRWSACSRRELIDGASEFLRDHDRDGVRGVCASVEWKWSCSRRGWAAGWMPRMWSSPEVAVITPIDFDHEAFLGSSIESIAAEKAGILKAGARRFSRRSGRRRSRFWNGARWSWMSPVTLSSAWRVEDLQLEKFGSRFTLASDEEIPMRCPLAGRASGGECADGGCGAGGVRPLGGCDQRGNCADQWPGRLERVATNPDIILDGAHNPAGARALAEYIRRVLCRRAGADYLWRDAG